MNTATYQEVLYITRKRHIHMLNFEKQIYERSKSIFFPFSHSPYKVACLEVWMPGIHNFGNSISRNRLQYSPYQSNFCVKWKDLYH